MFPISCFIAVKLMFEIVHMMKELGVVLCSEIEYGIRYGCGYG
ncbi:hypothetical protein FPSE_03938 [Fusarium pseudograminearum CS3096]|uniref:Uncharacterized protein n=1 Tax=Fusarium pseudograminearum (strain CS3096) TaxID=1028729 RepID=K3VPN1_FUSPC|nr:hypothetical protein FPSE_03938 [Fusarium pseudograminearum CS3096]EKJ75758.1 hypothetical protein FPSE_03938 [Fusarium pseudograminearum CS3096]